MTAQATIHFSPVFDTKNAAGRNLDEKSDLARYITELRKSIGKKYLDGSLNVRLYREMPRENGQVVLRNNRLIGNKVTERQKMLEGKTIKLGDLKSYGILKDRFVLYFPKLENNESFYMTIAQFPKEITQTQQDFLKKEVLRATS